MQCIGHAGELIFLILSDKYLIFGESQMRKGEVSLNDDLISYYLRKLNDVRKILNEVFYGLTIHEMDLELKKEKGHVNNLFMLIVFGDLIGLPLLPSYYSMRLLPYIIPVITTWKRSVLREKDLTDFVAQDI